MSYNCKIPLVREFHSANFGGARLTNSASTTIYPTISIYSYMVSNLGLSQRTPGTPSRTTALGFSGADLTSNPDAGSTSDWAVAFLGLR